MDLFSARHVLLILLILLLIFGGRKLREIGEEIWDLGSRMRGADRQPLPAWAVVAVLTSIALAIAMALQPIAEHRSSFRNSSSPEVRTYGCRELVPAQSTESRPSAARCLDRKRTSRRSS